MRNFVVNGLLGKNTRAIRNRAMVVVLVLLLAFTGSTYFLTKRLVAKINRQAVSMARQTMLSNRNALENEFERAANRTRYLAKQINEDTKVQNVKTKLKIIESTFASDSGYTGVWFAHFVEGVRTSPVFYSNGGRDFSVRHNPLYDKFILQVTKTGKTFVSEPYYSHGDAGERLVVSVVSSSFAEGNSAFVVGLELDLKELHDLLSTVDVTDTYGYVSVVSSGGMVVNHPDLRFVGKQISSIKPDGARLTNPSATDTSLIVDSEFLLLPVYRFYSSLPIQGEGKPWTLSVSIPIISLFGSSDEIQRMVESFAMIALSAIALVAVLLFFVWKIENVARQKAEQATEQLKQMQSKLVNSEKLATLGLLTAGIAHEINNPINFVLANLEPLKRDIAQFTQEGREHNLRSLKEEIELLVAGIENGALRTAGIVKDLGMFSRKETTLVSININNVIDSALALLHFRIKEGIVVDKQYGEVDSISDVSGNIVHAFLNILANAMDAVSEMEQKGCIWIVTGMRDDAVFVSIADNGVGISDETKRQIFEPFFTTKPAGQGVGLGLTITMTILEQSGATVEVLDREGGGSQFLITFGHGGSI